MWFAPLRRCVTAHAGGARAGVGGCWARGLFGQSFEVGTIEALERDVTGSRNAQWARAHKLIPGIIHGVGADGVDEVQLVYVRDADLRREVGRRGQTFSNTLFDIEYKGTRQRVLPRDFQVHPFRPKAICVNWLRYRPGAHPGALVDIPLRAGNEERCPAIKEGGWLLELTSKLSVFATGDAIPNYLVMDLRGLRAGAKIMASSVQLNEGLRLHSKVRDFAVAKLLGSRKGGDDADEGAAAGGAPAAAAAKPAAGVGAAKPAAAKDGGGGGGAKDKK